MRLAHFPTRPTELAEEIQEPGVQPVRLAFAQGDPDLALEMGLGFGWPATRSGTVIEDTGHGRLVPSPGGLLRPRCRIAAFVVVDPAFEAIEQHPDIVLGPEEVAERAALPADRPLDPVRPTS